MKTIAIDVRLIGRNRTGDEAVFRNLVRSVLELDRTDRFLLLTDRSDEDSLARLRTELGRDGRLPENAEVVTLVAGNRFMWNLISVPLFLLRRTVDVFHTQYILPSFIPSRTRVVTHIHDVSFRAFPEYVGILDRLFLSIFIPRTMRRSDLLIAPSRFTKDEIISRYGVGEEKVAIVPNAVDPAFLVPPTQADLARTKSRHALPETFILSVGTMQPRKNIPLLIRAFATLRKDHPDLGLVLVGGRDGKHYDRSIDDAIREEGLDDAVVFPGYVLQEDMPALYTLACVLCFPSLYEGFGIPILEAFAVGTPVVASDIPPFREVGGESVLSFVPGNIAKCAESLYTLLIDENARMRCERSGKDRLAGYAWAESARDMISCYTASSQSTH
ncbi:MAG: glycosyltransferase family 1 protein [Candidatus Moraniibacteriota bacterium]